MARKLEIEVVGDTKSLERALGTATKSSHKFGTALKAATIGAGAALGGLAVAAKIGFGEFMQGEKVTAQTNAVLKSTGGIANVTAKEVGNLAHQLMLKSGVDDEQIQAGENWLLTFKNVRDEVGRGNDIFKQATKASLDLAVAQATAKGGAINMAAASNMLGKALNDPIKGTTALGKAGVTFTAAQKKSIESLVKHGHALEAQKMILAEVQSQVKGSAAALGGTLGGQLSILRERFNNWAGDMVSKVIPSLLKLGDWVTKTAIPKLTELKDTLSGPIHTAFQTTVDIIETKVVPAFQKVVAATKDVVHFLDEHRTMTTDFAIALTTATAALTLYEAGVHVVHLATKAFAGAQLFLNAVMSANPIALVVIALAALVAGVIIAYRESETFRRIVQGAFKGVKVAVDDLSIAFKWVRDNFDSIWGIAKWSPPLIAIRAQIALVKGAIELVIDVFKWLIAHFDEVWGIAKWLPPLIAIRAQIALVKKAVELVADAFPKISAAIGKVRDAINRFSEIVVAFYNAAKALGAAIIDGIVQGIKDGAGAIKDALLGVAKDAYDKAKGFFHISSPSQLTREGIGRPIADGIRQGILDGSIGVSQALADLANKAVDRAKTVVQARGGEIGSWLTQAFSAKQGGQRTKTEKLIDEKELARETARLKEAVTSAQADLATAMAGDDPAAVATAQKALDEAKYQQWLAGAQKQAAAERVDLDQRQWLEQQAFQKRLANLQAYLESGHATAKGGKARILDLMHDFGIQASNMGELLGTGFANGIRKMIPLVAAAAEALRLAVKNEGILLRGRSITIALEDKADKKKQKQKGDAPGFTSSADKTINTGLWDELGLGRSMGLSLSSGYRAGAITVNGTPSKHGVYPSKAIDMAGDAGAMGTFARAVMRRSGIDEVFYDPLGYYMDRGSIIKGAIGGHSDHVHVGVFDRGGYLPPQSATLAINNTRRWEPVGMGGGGGGDTHFHFPHYIGSRDELKRAMRDAAQDLERTGTPLVSRSAPGFS